jgi:hypothetical protein
VNEKGRVMPVVVSSLPLRICDPMLHALRKGADGPDDTV